MRVLSDKDPLDKLAARLKAHRPAERVTKASRTHKLAEPNYTRLQAYCQSKKIPVGEVLDDLIAAFLYKVKDDLPPDLRVDSDT